MNPGTARAAEFLIITAVAMVLAGIMLAATFG